MCGVLIHQHCFSGYRVAIAGQIARLKQVQSGEAIAIGEFSISFFASERVRVSVSGLRCFATRKDGSCFVDCRDS